MPIYVCSECKDACILATDDDNGVKPEDCPFGFGKAKWERLYK